MEATRLWTYRNEGWATRDVVGYRVEALDGEIGKVDEASDDVDFTCLVVDTGRWIFGRKVLVPAGVVEEIDDMGRHVFVARTKEEIKNAPEYHEDLFYDEDFREELERYYGPREAEAVVGARDEWNAPSAR